MKHSYMSPSVIYAVALALLPISTTRAEDAKVPFARGVKTEVIISRPARIDRIQAGDHDNKTQVIAPRFKLTNTTTQQAYMGYKALCFLFCDSVADRNKTKVMLKHEFDITLPPRQLMDSDGGSVSTTFDENGVKWGYKYNGWVIQITDPKGEIVYTKSTSPSLEKLTTEIKGLKIDQCYDRQWKPTPSPRS
jgi:hypothetical protein